MKKFLIILIITVLFGMVSQANAIPISLSYGDSYYLGLIDDGIPSNPANEVVYINNLISLSAGAGPTPILTEIYDRSDSTLSGPFPTAVETGAEKEQDGEVGFDNKFDATGFAYILGKYDAGNAGSYVWYLGDNFIGEVELPSLFNDQYGLSHISAYNPNSVPEPATILLLATGLGGIAAVGRKKFIKK
jgi:hypothetical protein